MNRTRSAGSSAVSQFQLIGGISHDAGDCNIAVEPGGNIQARKGALYVVSEPAGDPARGGEACGLAQATLAHEYYADPSPSVTTSLTAALNKANNALLHHNRQVLAAGDTLNGLPGKIRVGLRAAVVRPGRVYLCRLKPGLILLVHGGQISAFPRPSHWPSQPETVNGDGEIVGNFYPAPSLGTGPMVEADFIYRSFDPGDLLILLSSTLAPLLDEDALAAALPGHSAADAVAYLSNLAQSAGLPEAHALAVELSAASQRRSERGTAIPPSPAWAPEADPASLVISPPHAEAAELADTPPTEDEAGDAPPTSSDSPRRTRSKSFGAARDFGRRAAPVVGHAGKVTLDAAGTAGKATLGVAGTAGKATLGAAGAVLGETLPESVRHRGGADASYPEGQGEFIDEEDESEAVESDDESDSAALPAGRIIDFDAPSQAAPVQAAPSPWLRRLVPIGILVVLGVLLFVVLTILSGQQAAKVNALLVQAQQAETSSHSGADSVRRTALLKAYDFAQQARDADPRSASATRMYTEVQRELDTLNGVTRLAGLSLLVDFNKQAPAPAPAGIDSPTPTPEGLGVRSVAVSQTAGLLLTATLGAQPAASATPLPGDYYSQVLVQGSDAFVLDKGAGRVYRVTLTDTQVSTLLSTGDKIGLVGGTDKARVGGMLFIAWRPTAAGGDLVLLDDTHTAYIWPPATGTWQAFALAGADTLGRPHDLAAYDGNLYMLGAKTGQISKWAAGAYSRGPVDWLSAAAGNEISSRVPIGMAIDGDVHLLLNDGQIMTFTAGEIKNTFSLPVWPQVTSPLAIFSTEATSSLYVVEFSDKRVIRVDKATGAVQTQLKAPPDSSAFDGIRNVYVDEAAGKIYILSGAQFYVAALPPLPNAPASSPTPGLPSAAPSPTAP